MELHPGIVRVEGGHPGVAVGVHVVGRAPLDLGELAGAVGGRAVTRAVTVKTKAKCQTCGTSNRSGTRFCKECGTALEII